jgi:hypothetical protein
MMLTRKVGSGDVDDDVTIKIGALTDAQLAALDIIRDGESALTFELRETLHRLTPPLASVPARTQPASPQIAILRWVVQAGRWAIRLGGPISQFATWSFPKALRQGLIGWTQMLLERWEVFRALSFAREPTRWTRLARTPQVSRLGRASELGDRS